MMNKPRPCPFCAHAIVRSVELRTRASFAGKGTVYGYAAECEACGARGPSAKDGADAVARWNVRNEQTDFFGPPTDVRYPPTKLGPTRGKG